MVCHDAKGSTVVADTYLRRLGNSLTECNLTAADYVKLPKRKKMERDGLRLYTGTETSR